MKKLLSILFICLCFRAQAQLYAPEIKVQSNPNGVVGINTDDPQSELDVNGNIYVGKTTNDSGGIIRFRRSDGSLNGYTGFSGNDLYMQNSSGSGVIKFLTNTDDSNLQEIMRIDGSGAGNVGIGTNNPTEKLHVEGNVFVGTNKLLFKGLYNKMNEIYSVGGSTGTHGSWYHTSYYDNIIINAGKDNSNRRKIIFRTGQNERMRVEENGYVGIGFTSPSEKLHVNGNILAANYPVTSDRKLKKDIKDYGEGLDIVNKISPVRFKYKPRKIIKTEIDTVKNMERKVVDWEEDDGDYIGVIAQDIQKIAPYLVGSFTDDEGEETLTVNQTAFTFILINAVKEQQQEIETLENRIVALEQLLQKKN